MQTVSGNWAGYLTSPAVQFSYGAQMCFPLTIVTSGFFTIGTSLIGGPDIIKSGGSSVSFFDRYQYADYSSYVVSFDVSQRISQYPYGTIMAQADITLANTSNLFTSQYDPTIGAYILAGRPLKLSLGFNGETLQQFTGFTANPQVSISERTVTFPAYDVFNYIQGYKSTNCSVQVGQRIDQIIAAGLAEMGFSSSQYVLDMSLMAPVVAMAPYGQYWGQMFQDFCETEQALMFVDEYGIIHFWNRQHMLDNSTVADQFSYSVIIDGGTEDTPIINDVIVTAQPLAIAADQSVWSLVNNLASPQLLSPSAQIVIECDFNDVVTALDTLEPHGSATTSSYTVNTNSDGSGADVTSSVSVVSVANWGSTAFVTLSNSSSVAAYVTDLNLWGTPAKQLAQVTTEYLDQTSVDTYGTNPGNGGQAWTIGPDYIQDVGNANSVAYTLVHEFKDGRQRYSIKRLMNPAIQFGDTVQLVMQDGYSLSFPNSGTASGSATGLPATNAAFWVSCFFNLNATDSSRHDLVNLLNGASGLALVLNGTTLQAEKGGASVLVSGSTSPSVGAWHNLLYTFDGTHHTLYLDGVSIGTSTTSPASVTPNHVYISTKDGTNEPFNGQLDTVCVGTGTLAPADIANIFKGSLSLAPNIVSEWLFNEGTGTVTNDSVGTNSLTVSSSTLWQALGCYGIKSMYVVGRSVNVTGDDISTTFDLEERIFASYFTIGTSLISGSDTIAP